MMDGEAAAGAQGWTYPIFADVCDCFCAVEVVSWLSRAC